MQCPTLKLRGHLPRGWKLKGGILAVAGAALSVVLAVPIAARASADSGLPAAIKEGGRVLQLVACGVRDTLWIDRYAAGLYLPSGAAVTSVADAGKPKAVRIRMIATRYVPEQIPEKWLVALEAKLPPEPLSRFRRAYRPKALPSAGPWRRPFAMEANRCRCPSPVASHRSSNGAAGGGAALLATILKDVSYWRLRRRPM